MKFKFDNFKYIFLIVSFYICSKVILTSIRIVQKFRCNIFQLPIRICKFFYIFKIGIQGFMSEFKIQRVFFQIQSGNLVCRIGRSFFQTNPQIQLQSLYYMFNRILEIILVIYFDFFRFNLVLLFSKLYFQVFNIILYGNQLPLMQSRIFFKTYQLLEVLLVIKQRASILFINFFSFFYFPSVNSFENQKFTILNLFICQ
eukprot:TRINITY_DN35567_c0_g1_i6.p1 TRINITY_DN35567_c0_g1~~TRINITY_DN35567_c0_g1_i6.p1  ORF type:complete len:200 (-),score=-18.97 TRINITY_DN35567_c0_g1_i6:1121-1720(-)